MGNTRKKERQKEKKRRETEEEAIKGTVPGPDSVLVHPTESPTLSPSTFMKP